MGYHYPAEFIVPTNIPFDVGPIGQAIETEFERPEMPVGLLLRDMLNPDDLVVGGQAFTEYADAMGTVEQAFAQRSVLPHRDIRVTAFGNRVQEAGAGIVSLGGIFADPIGAMRRAQARRPEVSA